MRQTVKEIVYQLTKLFLLLLFGRDKGVLKLT